jgi:hypothetical protein
MNKPWIIVHPQRSSPLAVASEEIQLKPVESQSLEVRGNKGYLVGVSREGSRAIIEIDFTLDKKCVKFTGGQIH